ncbi:hypothetical protein RJ55_00660 [Drechmeria coniospora]|nr:hypothetical protein RJ55_00660 [Drechmeria coniospora]
MITRATAEIKHHTNQKEVSAAVIAVNAVMILYRNLHGVVRCKFTMDKWRRGMTKAVVDEAMYEMTRLVGVWVLVVRGFERMSDLSYSPGIVHFHVGGHGRPEFTKSGTQDLRTRLGT